MAKGSIRQRVLSATMAVLLGGSVLQFGGCNSTVRDTLLTGLESTSATLAQTLITAFFATLTNDDDSGSGLTITP